MGDWGFLPIWGKTPTFHAVETPLLSDKIACPLGELLVRPNLERVPGRAMAGPFSKTPFLSKSSICLNSMAAEPGLVNSFGVLGLYIYIYIYIDPGLLGAQGLWIKK
jgi:hypothetical protein